MVWQQFPIVTLKREHLGETIRARAGIRTAGDIPIEALHCRFPAAVSVYASQVPSRMGFLTSTCNSLSCSRCSYARHLFDLRTVAVVACCRRLCNSLRDGSSEIGASLSWSLQQFCETCLLDFVWLRPNGPPSHSYLYRLGHRSARDVKPAAGKKKGAKKFCSLSEGRAVTFLRSCVPHNIRMSPSAGQTRLGVETVKARDQLRS